VASCAFCGKDSTVDDSDDDRGARSDALPLTWVTSVENGRTRVYCDRCARDHLRSIESKLHSEWWQ
jgi:hypothetical protein